MRIKKALTFWWHLLPKLNDRKKKKLEKKKNEFSWRSGSGQIVLKWKLQFWKWCTKKGSNLGHFWFVKFFFQVEISGLAGGLATWFGKMLESLHSCIQQRSQTGPQPVWPLWFLWGSVPLWNWTTRMRCGSQHGKRRGMRPAFSKCWIMWLSASVIYMSSYCDN